MRKIVVCLFVSLAFVTSSAYANYDAGLAAYKKNDYATAIKEWRPLADQGKADAQYNLGFCYYNGQGVPQNYKEAIKWFRMAADQGHGDAQYALAGMYMSPDSLDYGEAVKWTRKAADQGVAEAQISMGNFYSSGIVFPKDNGEALKWLHKAADQGNVKAFGEIAEIYEYGFGVPQDYKEAVKWYRLAAEKDDFMVLNILSRMYKNGTGVPVSRVMAYALKNLSVIRTPSKYSILADETKKGCEKLLESMTKREVVEAKALAHEIAKPHNLLKVLDEYDKG